MNYIEKNRRNIIIAAIGVLSLVAILILWFQKRVVHSSDDIVAGISKTSLNINDTLSFFNKTEFGKTVKWDFADGSTSDKNNGTHFFKKSGFYTITITIDNKYNKTFPVLVSNEVIKVSDTTKVASQIEGPLQALQLENVFFRAISPDATTFSWRFGESGNIDSKEKMPSYSYTKAGTYKVVLTTDVDQVEHIIKVLPQYNDLEEEVAPPPLTVGETVAKIDNDFKYRLQQIANGNNFNMNYNHLLNTYLCGNNNLPITVNGKAVTFYNYCIKLQFDKNTRIHEAKITFDADQNCVTNVEVKQSENALTK